MHLLSYLKQGLLIALLIHVYPHPAWSQTITNPLLPDGADPWVTHENGWFYYTHTVGDKLVLWRTRNLAQLAQAEHQTVWTPPAAGPNSRDIWAPELHRLDGKWYLYYTATDKAKPGDHNRYVFVLENSAANPLQGQWTDRGKLNTQFTGLDGSVMTHNGRRYFLYSAYDGPQSVLNIVRMQNPWTLEGPEVTIARPTYDWEKYDGREICEGPEFLQHDARSPLCIVYSASACWDDDYCLGLLTAPADADPMNAAAWTKRPKPVFEKSEANGVYGPGHNGFFKTPNGQDWIVYHAKSVANKACKARNPRMQSFTWQADGTPNFGIPVSVTEKSATSAR